MRNKFDFSPNIYYPESEMGNYDTLFTRKYGMTLQEIVDKYNASRYLIYKLHWQGALKKWMGEMDESRSEAAAEAEAKTEE